MYNPFFNSANFKSSFGTTEERKNRKEKTVKELILKDNEVLQITTAVEGPLGYENSKDYRLSEGSDGRLNVEKMTPGGWRRLR